jgi:hypothetical protein
MACRARRMRSASLCCSRPCVTSSWRSYAPSVWTCGQPDSQTAAECQAQAEGDAKEVPLLRHCTNASCAALPPARLHVLNTATA